MRVEYVGPDPDEFEEHYKKIYPSQGYGTRIVERDTVDEEAELLILTRWTSCE